MVLSRRWTTVGITVLAALVGCGSLSGCGKKETLNIGGATFIYPMMDKWSFEYQKAKGVKVNYNSSGSGTGIQQMIAKTLDFGCSDAPLTDKQIEEAKASGGDVVHIPLAMGAVVPAYNLKEVEKPLTFTGPVLADIYLGKIKKWNDKAIKDLNEGVDLPDKNIAVCSRLDGSGTTYIWVDYLAKVSPEWKEKVGVSTSVKFPVGVGGKGNEGVAGFVKENDGAIGYVELIYAKGNNIKYGPVVNKAGKAVLANLESVTAAAAGELKTIPEDLRYSLTNAEGEAAYPIAGTNWAICYVKQPAAKKDLIVNFLTWVTHDGQQFCEGLHYAKLPAGLVERLEKKIAMIQAQ
jgi:phosphate ABC transporter phosphate-binding protein